VSPYAWDLDGDGSFETDTGSAPIAKRTFGAVGVYDVAVRVTELDGDVGTVRRRVEVLERHPSRDLIPWIPVHTAAPPPPPSAFIAPEPKEAIPGPTAPTVTAPQAPRRTTGTTDGLVRPKLVSMRWTSRRTLLVGVRGEPGMKLRLRADLPAKSAATLKLSRRDIPLGSRSVVVGRDGQANVTLRLHRRWTAIAARGGRRMLRVLLLVRKSDNPGF
jgi:hypothetical protein